MIQTTVNEYVTSGPEEGVEVDFAVCALDAIASLAEGFVSIVSMLLVKKTIGINCC